MKKIILFALFASLGLSAKAQTNVTINIANIESEKGNINIGIYSKSQGFPNENISGKFIKKRVAPKKGSVQLTVSLAKGTYAIAVFQDINKNQKLDKNFVGSPEEPYGFSKNIFHTFSAPTFDECKFKLEDKKRTFTINLKQ